LKKIVRHSEATAEVLEAFDWYASKSPKAAEAFLIDLENGASRHIHASSRL
jgi:hypothetical protein